MVGYILYSILAIGFLYLLDTARLLRKRSNESMDAKKKLLAIHNNVHYLINNAYDFFEEKAFRENNALSLENNYSFFNKVREIVNKEQIDNIEKFDMLLSKKDKFNNQSEDILSYLIDESKRYKRMIIELNIKK